MNNSVFCKHWHLLSNYEIVKLYDQLPHATVPPSADITSALKLTRIANLELLENRSHSSVYRIKQTDQVFQIFINTGKTLCFNTHSYRTQKEQDNLITQFNAKDPVFSIKLKNQDELVIVHHKEPRFEAVFSDGQLRNTNWLDNPPADDSTIETLMRKLHAFYSGYVSPL